MAIAIQTTFGIGLWKDILLLQRQHLAEYHLASGGGPMGFIGEIDDTKKKWNHGTIGFCQSNFIICYKTICNNSLDWIG